MVYPGLLSPSPLSASSVNRDSFQLAPMSIDGELESLKTFGDALREESRLLFEKMMSELDPETLKKARVAKDPFEVVAMALILNQQKIIRELMQQLKKQSSGQ